MSLYKYSASIIYLYNDLEYIIDSTHIKNIVIDYDYDNKNMPIVLITAAIDKKVIDDMILNSRKKTMTLTISKYLKDSPMIIKKNYIHGQFIYFLSDNLNSGKDLDYENNRDGKEVYRKITIGMVDINLINKNKRMINDIFINTNLIDIILKHTSHMKLLIEPVANIKVNRFIIPPVNSITNFIKFTDFNYSLYPTEYRLFYDFDKSYLISSAGNNVPAIGEDINTVIINVNKNLTPESKSQGLYIDNINKVYIIELSTSDIRCLEDKATDISYNQILTIGSDGTYKFSNLNLNDSITGPNKIRIERMTNNNINQADNITAGIVNSSMAISFIKTELDTSILTINRKFIVKNYEKLGNRDGTFILAAKKEIYTPDGGDFILTTAITLRKAIIS